MNQLYVCTFSSVQSLSRVWLFATPWTAACRLPCPSPTPGACSNSCPSVGDAIQPSHPLLSPSPAFNLSQHQGLLQCMKVKSESEVAQWCPTLSNPMDCSLPGSSIHGLFQARVLEWPLLSPCPSPTAGVYSNSCPFSRWCHPAISSSVVPFSCL